MSMPRQPTTYQLDLFSKARHATTAQMPQWQALPAEARRSLTKLMVRLLLGHVGGDHAPERQEMLDDI
jgi:hypothetical protein